MKNIQQIYEMLSWENSPEIQQKGIQLAKEIKDLSQLILPLSAPPSAWEACATILDGKSDEELEPYLPELFDWINDINWPGGFVIFHRLLRFSGKRLRDPFIQCVEAILKQNKEDDDRWLYSLSTLLENQELKDLLPEKTVEILLIHRNQWENWDS